MFAPGTDFMTRTLRLPVLSLSWVSRVRSRRHFRYQSLKQMVGQIGDFDAFLFPRVAITHGDGLIFE